MVFLGTFSFCSSLVYFMVVFSLSLMTSLPALHIQCDDLCRWMEFIGDLSIWHSRIFFNIPIPLGCSPISWFCFIGVVASDIGQPDGTKTGSERSITLCVFSSSSRPTQPVSPPGAMLRQILLNSTDNADFDLVLMAQSSTHSPSSLNASHGGSVSVAALLRPTTVRGGGGLREGELHKPDLITYIVMCLLLFLLVLLIVFFINCQLRNSFFASMPYDRSLREARTSYK